MGGWLAGVSFFLYFHLHTFDLEAYRSIKLVFKGTDKMLVKHAKKVYNSSMSSRAKNTIYLCCGTSGSA